ncbi:acyl-CoA dehydrogenase family protein [Arthrobacter sp. Br18]|uniref:acyl-CoA dehydrogenase family protein n=1 Tax=Arthrobacter sp. Br18 TaxID=1312954 RepID=UPI000687513A|nr:acyl-CoA dehydrogenase family protein [Arthrobacter sp. Br18]
MTRVLTATRSGASWESVGHGIAAYEAAVTYAKQGKQFGKPIASYQLVQNKLANMLAELTAMQLICFRLAVLADQGRMTGPMASLAKMHTYESTDSIQSLLIGRDITGVSALA